MERKIVFFDVDGTLLSEDNVIPPSAIKAVQWLQAKGIKQENCYAFGDGLNDIEMLKMVGTGVAMGSAPSEVKEAADVITTACTEDGILKGLQKVGLLEEKDFPIKSHLGI